MDNFNPEAASGVNLRYVTALPWRVYPAGSGDMDLEKDDISQCVPVWFRVELWSAAVPLCLFLYDTHTQLCTEFEIVFSTMTL